MSSTWSTRRLAIRALGDLAPADPDVVRLLGKVLTEDADITTRQLTLTALERAGPAAREVLPAIRSLGEMGEELPEKAAW